MTGSQGSEFLITFCSGLAWFSLGLPWAPSWGPPQRRGSGPMAGKGWSSHGWEQWPAGPLGGWVGGQQTFQGCLIMIGCFMIQKSAASICIVCLCSLEEPKKRRKLRGGMSARAKVQGSVTLVSSVGATATRRQVLVASIHARSLTMSMHYDAGCKQPCQDLLKTKVVLAASTLGDVPSSCAFFVGACNRHANTSTATLRLTSKEGASFLWEAREALEQGFQRC